MSSKTFHWTNQQVILLIKLFQQQPHLYDISHRDYRNSIKRQLGYHSIQQKLKQYRKNDDITITEIKRKLKALRTSFHAEFKRIEEKNRMFGTGFTSSLWYYNEMQFLINHFHPNRGGLPTTSSKKISKPHTFATKSENGNRKCGEMYVNNDGVFTFLCCECGQVFEKAKLLGKHLLEEHLTKIQSKNLKVEVIDSGNNDDDDDDNADNSVEAIGIESIEVLIKEEPNTEIDLGEFLLHNENIATNNDDDNDRKPYKCNLCGQKFRFERILTGHMKINHNEDTIDVQSIAIADNNLIESNESEGDNLIISCDYCEKQFLSIQAHTTHIKHYHTPQICPTCGQQFSNRKNINNHIKRMHNTSNPNFICDMCQTTFKDKGNLTKHMRIHTKERPYKCDICDKTFAWSSYLTIHRRMHNVSEMTYVCDLCGARFACTSKLNMHIKMHNKVRRYKCDKCSETYYRIESLKKHQLKHYDGSFVCKVCNRDCTSRDWLRDHKCHSQRRPPRKRTVGLDVERNVETISAEELFSNETDILLR